MSARATDPVETVCEALDTLAPPGLIGLAVSGGGDSVALMRLAAIWARRRGRGLAVACVDHGLRKGSAAEALAVCAQAAALGLSAETLAWAAPGWPPRGNLQDAARRARTRLLADWAARTDAVAVALGHTADDQAETVLMRLARGAGADGLSGMAARSRRDGALWLRPLLTLRRDALRDWLRAEGASWIDDPTNDNLRFERVKARAALRALAPLGVTVPQLAATARRMRDARAALDAASAALWAQAGREDLCGALWLDREKLTAAPDETAARLLAAALSHVGRRRYGPRAASRDALLRAARGGALGGGRTLAGCVLADAGDWIAISREPSRAPHAAASHVQMGRYDGRWRVTASADGVVGPLGETGEAQLAQAARTGWPRPDGWRAAPRPARLATPALWRAGRLICAPCAGFGDGLTATPQPFRPGCASIDSDACVE